MKTTICMAFFAIAATCALAEVPPVLTTEPVAQKWGEEADDEVQRDGLLFWRDDCGALYIGDGETPGGKAVCVGLPPDLYSWTNDVSANGHALRWGGGWSQQAEGGSLLVRLGTNSWFRFVAADAGTLANLAVSDLDQANGTMRLTADTADPGAVLLVATNLLDPEAWQPATNGEVVATTDASTTWLITLLDTPFEVYRVRTSVTLEAGIHAERTLHANAGIRIPEGQQLAFGTNSIGGWSDLFPYLANAFLTAETDPVALAALDAHVADTDNPHGVTAAQVGAPTVADLNAVSNALNTKFSSYLPLTGGIISGGGSLGITNHNGGARFFQGNNVDASGVYASAMGEYAQATAQDASAIGYHVIASAFAAMARGGWTEATKSYATAMGRTATSSNELAFTWSGVDLYPGRYGSHGDGTWNINPKDGLSGAYVGETNLADHLAAAVAPVEERVGALESELHDWPDTCLIYWDDEYVTDNWNEATRTIPIPTNFPTRRLDLIVSDDGITNLTVNLPKWTPDRSVEIFVQIVRTTTAPTNRATTVRINNNSTAALTYSSYYQYRVVIMRYDVVSESWGAYTYTQPYRSYWWSKSGSRTMFPTDCPATVEQWIAAWEARNNGTPTLSMSRSLSPSAGHLELLDSLDALNVPAADEPDEFEPAEVVE